MVSRAAGAFEIIGLRAVMLDVRQYVADGKRIQTTNEQIGATSKKLQDVNAQQVSRAASLIQAHNRVAAAAVGRAKAEQALALAIAANPNQPRVNGTFVQRPEQAALVAAKAELVNATKAELALEREIERTETQRVAINDRLVAQQGAQAKATAERKNILTSTAAVGVTIAAIAGTAASIKAAADYQTALGKISTLTEATTEDTQALGKSLLDLSKTVPVSPGELGATAYQVLSSGIKDLDQALKITELSAQGEAIGLGKAADVARTITTVINAYGSANIKAAQASDILVEAVKLGSGDAEDFANSLGRILPIAAATGVKFDEVAASVASLTNQGLSAEEAVTALRGILSELEAPTQQGSAALFAIGTNIENVRKDIRERGLIPTLTELSAKFNNNSEAVKLLIPNIRAATGFQAAFGAQGQKTVDILGKIDTAGGATADAFKKVKDNVAIQAKIFKNELNTALIQIGTQALPQVTQGLKELGQFLTNNQGALTEFGQIGVKAVVGLLEDLVKGLLIAAKALIVLHDTISSIAGSAAADKAAIAGIGAALFWALPGGPYIKGLILIATLLGEISGSTGPKGSIAQELASRNQKQVQIGPLKSGGFLNKLLLGSSEGLTDAQLAEAKAAAAAGEKTDFLSKALKKADDATRDINISLPQLQGSEEGVGKAALLTAEEMLGLQKAFRSASEAAGEVDALTAPFDKLFAEIPKRLADALNLTATQAGNIQGIDAVAAHQARAANEAYKLASAIATVAEAMTKDVGAANELANAIAQQSLEASQAAANQLFSKPTREVANLDVGIAQSQARSAQIAAQNNPTLRALQQQLRNISTAISHASSAANKTGQTANRQQAAMKAGQDAAANNANNVAQQQLDALQYANLQAKVAAERTDANFQKLIEADTKQLSDLQAAFLASNEDLQRQINAAIGKGDTGTALSLADQQRQAAAAFQASEKKINQDIENTTLQQKQAQEAEAERQRQAELAEAALQLQAKANQAIEDSTKAVGDNSTSFQDNSTAVDETTQRLSDQRDAIQSQIDSLTNQQEAQDDQTKKLQEQKDVLTTQTDILKAQVVAADQTLKTQAEQYKAAQLLVTQISTSSGAVKHFSDALGIDTIKEINEANRQFVLLQGVLDAIQNPHLQDFIDKGIDPASARLQILAGTATDANVHLGGLGRTSTIVGGNLTQFEKDYKAATTNILKDFTNIIGGLDKFLGRNTTSSSTTSGTTTGLPKVGLNTGVSGGSLSTRAYGGFIGSPEIAQLHPPEMIIPYNHPARAKELIAQLPANLLAGVMAKKQASAIFAPNIMVTGETLDTMETVALAALTQAFRDARSVSGRSGSLLTSGIG